MKPNDVFADLPADEHEELARLVETAANLRPDESFIKRTEVQLKDAFAAKREKTMKHFNLLWQVLAGTAAVAALALGTIWLVRIVVPEPHAPSVPVKPSFVCPVTQPNGSLPPGETNPSPYYLGNGQLWTALWPEGKIVMSETDNREPDGSLSMKWGWVRGVSGPLSIEGRRLDGAAGPLRALIPSGYGDSGLQITALIFPTTGCWEVTGRVGDASLTFITEVVMAGEAPMPEPTPIRQPTATPAGATYDWHRTTVYRAVDFPQMPTEAKIYTHSAPTAATIESARKLAERFGIQGEVFQDPNGPSIPSFLVADGKQRLFVSSAERFSYYSDFSQTFNDAPVSQEVASIAIDTFLKDHSFDFNFQILPANGIGPGWFYVIPLTVDGKAVRFDFGLAQRLEVHIGPDGQIIRLDAYLLSQDPQPVGVFGVISAEAAWQKFLNDAPFGVLQSTHSGGSERSLWHRVYPDNQPVTVYGSITSFASVEAGQPPLIAVNDFTATGNISGMEKLAYNTFAQAQGQFFSENGTRKFKVDSWQTFDQSKMLYLDGSLRNEGGNIIFSSQGTDYSLEAVPPDVPVPVEKITITGMANGTRLDWQSIMYLKDGIRGGGGGGGGEFAKLNLSGAPVPWPTFAPALTPESLTGQRMNGQSGLLTVNVYQKTDGIQRTEYTFATLDNYYYLQGQGLDQLQAYHNRPVKIWGAVTGYNQYQAPVLSVERYEVPYPDLKFQILRGKQKIISLEGQRVTLFTSEDGKSYVQLIPIGLPPIDQPDGSLIGKEGDLVQEEVLAIPDETFGGYPTIRVFGGGLADNPKTGQPEIPQITANKPNIMPETPQTSGVPPMLTIETIELVYYTVDPRYSGSYPDAMTPYLQPVWRFYGHYADGSWMEILVQALKQEFLLPEAAPAVQGG